MMKRRPLLVQNSEDCTPNPVMTAILLALSAVTGVLEATTVAKTITENTGVFALCDLFVASGKRIMSFGPLSKTSLERAGTLNAYSNPEVVMRSLPRALS